jgi:hypothetical protein
MVFIYFPKGFCGFCIAQFRSLATQGEILRWPPLGSARSGASPGPQQFQIYHTDVIAAASYWSAVRDPSSAFPPRDVARAQRQLRAFRLTAGKMIIYGIPDK